MDAVNVSGAFLHLIEKSQLLVRAEIDAASHRHSFREMGTAEEIADLLVADGLLTRFQADRLLSGRYRGFVVGGYKVLDLLGAGGMGWLYVAKNTQTGEKVALKVLSEHLEQNPEMTTRFKLEGKAGAKLRHPNIVRTHKIGRTDDYDYVVMELVEGISLQEMIDRGGPCPYDQACDLICQAAKALEYAHQNGLIHRDIKPANLLVDYEGRARMLDFGLALMDGDEDEFSLAMIFGQNCVGTADYIAPEQSVDSYKVDARADVYSLGCTFYFALSGEVPFPSGSTSDKVASHRTKKARPLSEIVPGIPKPVAKIVERMMAKDPNKRFQSARDVRGALEPFAKRHPAAFDFQDVLAERADEFRRRIAILKKLHRKAKTGSTSSAARGTSSTASASSMTGSQARAAAETVFTDDTQTKRSAISLVDPFDALKNDHDYREFFTSSQSDRANKGWKAADLRASLIPIPSGSEFPLSLERVIIGRSSQCDLVLPYSHVSNRHCELKCEGSWWRVTDLNSKNGVRVNGVAVQDQLLWPGDKLIVGGRSQFRIEYDQGDRRRGTMMAMIGIAAMTVALMGLAAATWWWMG